MFMGSQHVPVGRFDELLEAAGANNNGTTNFDRTNYYETGPSNALPLMLWLDADRMGWLLPTMDLPKSICSGCCQDERRESVDKRRTAVPSRRFIATLSPLSSVLVVHIGSMEDIGAASLDDGGFSGSTTANMRHPSPETRSGFRKNCVRRVGASPQPIPRRPVRARDHARRETVS